MSEIILALTLIAFFIYHAWYVREGNRDRKRLIKAIMSKDVQEFTNSEVVEESSKKPQTPPDAVDMQTLDDEQFTKLIKKQTNG